MSYAVYSDTGNPFRIAEGVLYPTEPMIVDKLTDEMEFQRVNLRIVEVDEDGEEVPNSLRAAPETLDPAEQAAAVEERDRLQGKVDQLTTDLGTARTEIGTLKQGQTELTDKHNGEIRELKGKLTQEAKDRQAAETKLAASEQKVQELITKLEEATKPAAAYAVDGLTADQNATLIEAYPTREALDLATDEDLDALKGFGPATLKTLRAWQEANKL